MRKTKIVCTLGPAVDDMAVLKELIQAGMNVARMNFSHGTHPEHLTRLQNLRRACDETGMYVSSLLDTKGPEIRLGLFEDGETFIEQDSEFILTTEEVTGTSKRAAISYKGLPADVQKGSKILLDDGLIALEVTSVAGTEIHCRAMNSGKISNNKSINVPDVSLNLPSLTDRDKADILFAIENEMEFIAVSFVRKKEDITVIERFLNENGGAGIKLIAKIESREGLNNIDEIIRVSDGIMVARGDLGVEIPLEELPIAQKDMISKCYRSGKPVITATQMLDSMIRNPRPTRAEVTDVANAIFDGTSALMLSGETAVGKYPVQCLETMVNIARVTEDSIDYWERFRMDSTRRSDAFNSGVTAAISHATCSTAMDIGAAAIVAATASGFTARRISSFRPECPIVAVAATKQAFGQLCLSWGVYPVFTNGYFKSSDELFDVSVSSAKSSGLAKDGDLLVVTAGLPAGTVGTTNMLKVQMVGDTILRGIGLNTSKVTAPVCVFKKGYPEKDFVKKSILVTDEISEALLPLAGQALALILDGPDKDGQAATLAKALGIPVVVEAEGALRMLKSGSVVTVDAAKGIVSRSDR